MNFLASVDWAGLGLKVLSALVVLVLTFLVAMLVKSAVVKLSQRVKALQRGGADGGSLGNAIGTIASMIIWLLGLIIILGIFELSQVLTPVTTMLEQGLGHLPNIVAAVFVFVIGLVIAKILRSLIVTALGTVDFGKLLGTARSGIEKATGTAGAPAAQAQQQAHGQAPQQAPGQAPQKREGVDVPEILASVVFALVMIVVSIAALQILGIASISDPASQMLTAVFTAIPNIIAAAILVGIGVLIARFVSGLLTPILEGSGIDGWLQKQDMLRPGTSVAPTVAKIVEIAVVLFFAVMAAQVLGFSQITALLSEILELGGSVLFGAAIVAAGFFIASIVAKLLSGTAATVVKWAIIVLFTAMGLQSMGVADSIIEMAFGALVIGGAAAAVLAFGLGGRDAAARQLSKLEQAQAQAQAQAPSQGSASQGDASGPSAGGTTTVPPRPDAQG
ncbi:mechanosensitive ion channel [Brachybacterium sp. AOP43-C2-M15]|uniref:mechanosensitive ion channel n=1 Tax=Brachybacterium sp. AOP43-C2-M15 TaxID=3457661 RepID=UPI004033F5DE